MLSSGRKTRGYARYSTLIYFPLFVLPDRPLESTLEPRSRSTPEADTTMSRPPLTRTRSIFGGSRVGVSGPGVCVCNSSHKSIIWRAESRTHLSKQTRPSTEHFRKASNVRGIPSMLDDQLRWVLIARSQV